MFGGPKRKKGSSHSASKELLLQLHVIAFLKVHKINTSIAMVTSHFSLSLNISDTIGLLGFFSLVGMIQVPLLHIEAGVYCTVSYLKMKQAN